MTDYKVGRRKWASFTIFEQMGNIYSEVGQSFSAQKLNDTKAKDAAMVRAIDLFDATTEELVKNKSPKTKEVLRAKEMYLKTLFDGDEIQRSEIEKYFMQFAIAARLHK